MAEEVFARGMPVAELARAWPEVVGERLSRGSARFRSRTALLTVEVSNGPWGAQVRFLHEEIRRRADEALGGGKVRRVRIVVRAT